MLGKLIKYEFKATARTMLPLVAATILLAVLTGFSLLRLNGKEDYGFLQIIFILITVAFFLCLFAVNIMAVVVMVQRFYKNLLGAEGYLMFTLPVSADALVCAKLVVSVAWFAISLIVSALGMATVAVIGASAAFTPGAFSGMLSEFTYYLNEAAREVGTGNLVGYAAELILAAIISGAAACLQFYLAMAIGQSFSSHKGLYSVLAFFAISFVMNILAWLGVGILNWISAEWNLNLNFDIHSVDLGGMAGMTHLLFAVAILSALIPALIYYFPTSAILKRRLNLT